MIIHELKASAAAEDSEDSNGNEGGLQQVGRARRELELESLGSEGGGGW